MSFSGAIDLFENLALISILVDHVFRHRMRINEIEI